MARCDEGYPCEVCGEYVHNITDSDLYLRYVLGEVGAGALSGGAERHLRCNPTLSQFITDPKFPPVTDAGDFAKAMLDPDWVAAEERRVTAGWLRLREVVRAGVPIDAYPVGGS